MLFALQLAGIGELFQVQHMPTRVEIINMNPLLTIKSSISKEKSICLGRLNSHWLLEQLEEQPLKTLFIERC